MLWNIAERVDIERQRHKWSGARRMSGHQDCAGSNRAGHEEA